MKKYILKDGKEVKFGDTIYAKTNFNGFRSVVTATLDEYTVDMLKGLGIIKEIEVKDPVSTETKNKINDFSKFISSKLKEDYIEDVIEYVANKLGVKYCEAVKYLTDLETISPVAVLNIYLKRIAYRLNKGYDKKPIRDLDKIYIISLYDGKVKAICPKDIKNLKHFAWFRSAYDAEFARNCVIELIERMFGKDDQSEDK